MLTSAISVPELISVHCHNLDLSFFLIVLCLPVDATARSQMNVGLGDLLTIELVDGSIVLKPSRDADTKS